MDGCNLSRINKKKIKEKKGNETKQNKKNNFVTFFNSQKPNKQ